MMSFIRYTVFATLLLLYGCQSKPSLEKYFVDNTENKNFVVLDLTPDMLQIDKTKLSVSQQQAMSSFEKLNILAFKSNDKNKQEFDAERAKIKTILKDKKYQSLMKFGSGKEGVQISYSGPDDHIEEVVVFANEKNFGFAIIRILGKNINANNVMDIVTVLKNGNINSSSLEPLKNFFNKSNFSQK